MNRRLTEDPPLGRTGGARRPARPTLEAAPPVARRRRREPTDWGLVGVLAGLGVAAAGMVWFGVIRHETQSGVASGPQAIAARPDTTVPGEAGMGANAPGQAAPGAIASGQSVPLPSGLSGPAAGGAPAAAPLPASVPYKPTGGLMGPSDPMGAREVGVAPTPKVIPGGDRPVQVTNDVESLKPKVFGTLRSPTKPKD